MNKEARFQLFIYRKYSATAKIEGIHKLRSTYRVQAVTAEHAGRSKYSVRSLRTRLERHRENKSPQTIRLARQCGTLEAPRDAVRRLTELPDWVRLNYHHLLSLT